MNIPPLSAFLITAGACVMILPLMGVPLRAVMTPQGLAIAFVVLLVILLVLTLIQPMTRPKQKGPTHPMTKAGNLFALIGLVFAGLSFLLNAGLGLFTAGTFFLIAIICWVFGTAFAKRA